jgi:ABC-type multidrug transport system ATPase subunit/DNA-binding beta-propeller fold protein YncE
MPGEARPRLDGVSVGIERGVTAILGASGAGKTSLLNLLVEFEDAGSGVLVRELPEAPMPVYWAPQGGGLWPHLTAEEHLLAVSPSDDTEHAREMLARFDLDGCADQRSGELSMGERGRLGLARALAAEPAVLVLDEPLAHVDRARHGRFWGVVREYVARTGCSLVFATHSPELVLSEADRVICLREGRLVYDGPVEQLYHSPDTREQAECLGEVNWLKPEEARLWFGPGLDGRRCYRPEHLEVAPEPDGELVVTDYRFRGPVAQTRLEHTETGETRSFLHRTSERLREGQHVVLRVLMVIMLMLLVACADGGQEGALDPSKVDAWTLPRKDLSVPKPRGVAVGYHDGKHELYVVDTGGRVLVYDEQGELLRQWDMPLSGMGTAEGACVLQDGRIAVADTHYFRVLIFDRQGNVVDSIGKVNEDGDPIYGDGPGEFMYPVGVIQDDDGFLYVCEYGGNDRVQKFTPAGEHVMTIGRPGTKPDEFQRPQGLTFLEGHVYVADAVNHRISVFNTAGEFVRTMCDGTSGPEIRYPYDVTAAPDGHLWIAEWGGGRVTCITPDGRLVGRFGSKGRGTGQFYEPWGITTDKRGRVYVADTGNSRIVEIAP